ncbi:MAG: hypothetical protein NPIRA02_25400 [Nitrospirales bacterium]|nr:MAG: hypothetical protein NPIRA02_25400 [Nitrospirales bacterium]
MASQKLLIGIILVVFVGVTCLGLWAFSVGSIPTIRIRADEFRFSPETITVMAFQEVRFVISNDGRERHTFSGSLLNDDRVRVVWDPLTQPFDNKNAVHLARGQSVSFTATFPAGLYPFRCVIQGHRGMEGVIVVRREGIVNVGDGKSL